MQTIIIIHNAHLENKNPYHIISQEMYFIYIYKYNAASHYYVVGIRHGGNHSGNDGVADIKNNLKLDAVVGAV